MKFLILNYLINKLRNINIKGKLGKVKDTVLVESSYFINFYRDLSAPAMSTDMSQVGVALFPSF